MSVNNNRRGRKNSRAVYVENTQAGADVYSRTMKYYQRQFPDGK